MNYLKTPAEVINYCPRVSVPAGKELIYSNIASRMVDEFCTRSLSIQYYLLDFELSDSLVGRIPKRPIIEFAPDVLSTGVQIRPMTRTYSGGRQELSGWADYTFPTGTSDTPVNLKTGRFEIFRSSSGSTDYGRTNPATASSWQVQVEVFAGFFVDTTLAQSAPHSTNTIFLTSVVGLEVGTRVNFGASSTIYTIQTVDTNTGQCTITPMLAGTQSVGTEITEVVPEDVRIALGMIIEDRLTYEPNTLRQTETLDVITDRFSRHGVHFIPLDAQRLLTKYKN